MGPGGGGGMGAAAEKAKRLRCSVVPVIPSPPTTTTTTTRRRDRCVQKGVAGLNYASIRRDETGCNLWLIANENQADHRQHHPIILNPRAATARPARGNAD